VTGRRHPELSVSGFFSDIEALPVAQADYLGNSCVGIPLAQHLDYGLRHDYLRPASGKDFTSRPRGLLRLSGLHDVLKYFKATATARSGIRPSREIRLAGLTPQAGRGAGILLRVARTADMDLLANGLACRNPRENGSSTDTGIQDLGKRSRQKPAGSGASGTGAAEGTGRYRRIPDSEPELPWNQPGCFSPIAMTQNAR